ncbi:MAG: tRNA pseudouridine(13) synthase TruD, partial [Candidatus Bipolaricaulaceae bacterium]
VVLRDLSPDEAKEVQNRFALLARQGFPNYFDLQRFGSYSARLGFPGKLLLRGDWEGALRAYLAEPLLGDPPPVRRFKAVAHAHWGEWELLKAKAPRGNLRSVLTFLCDHPQDFKRAVNLITPRVLSLWLSAYQSFLWNRAASRVLEELVGENQALVFLRFPWGAVVAPAYPLDPELLAKLGATEIPLPSAKMRTEGGLQSALSGVLMEEGLSPADLKARGVERAHLSAGVRLVWVVPSEPQSAAPVPDELFPSRQRLTLAFVLPPGSYATLLLRHLGEPRENLTESRPSE